MAPPTARRMVASPGLMGRPFASVPAAGMQASGVLPAVVVRGGIWFADQEHGGQEYDDAGAGEDREMLSEKQDSQDGGCDRFEQRQDGRGGGADALLQAG
jgi:hypothetical protein